jgi:hypothetical protein
VIAARAKNGTTGKQLKLLVNENTFVRKLQLTLPLNFKISMPSARDKNEITAAGFVIYSLSAPRFLRSPEDSR